MSTEEITMEESSSAQMPTEPAAMALENKKRPRLDVSDTQKRKRGMFGVLLGTLKQAKQEDKERNASEAAKKRQLIDQRLQSKLKKETDSVRRAEEARKDKLTANRKEEDLQLKDSIYKLRRSRLPLLANFLLTSDIIPPTSSDDDPAPLPLPFATVPRGHPPPLYYLPAVLTPAQESYISRRKAQILEAVDNEYTAFLGERTTGIAEILELRKAVADEEARKREAKSVDGVNQESANSKSLPQAEMEVDDHDSATLGSKDAEEETEKKEELPADGDDAVEY
ncbi:Pinin-SDK-memA domain-containing protein [Mycena indigotica]|uniref:Pinin-SDK-memA domain-containing protein n=1 Tax=Mycena indigotica TaxID=2126181 RepID=A0A8H6WB05_9AGAR|nr:Pinin-SDK-memA domain-containing protein [Mycena indigotica]KAF7309706.1 Pinin-SDK-memA domain-containing protein [Mycena indigotica]